ncbi:MAG: flagellar biosynthesis anti-sigma factor FlgM [Lachnotalea sp.]
MRIEAYTQLSKLYNTEKTNNIKQDIKTSKNDKIEISQQGLDYQVAKKAVAESIDVRDGLVNQYKSAIQAGEYSISAKEFANKVIESYNKNFM